MSELVDKLRTAAAGYKDTELGGLLQWAALHIDSQDEALAELRESHAEEEAERLHLERALHTGKQAAEATLAALSAPLCPPIEFGRDLVPHINLMAGHGDPDYLKTNGMSVRHVDCRETRKRKAKAT